MRSSECDVVSLYVVWFSVNVFVVFCVACLTVFSVYGGALLDRPCMVFQRVCVLCL